MKPLKNARHEKFVLNLLKGMTQTEAAIQAGYASSRAYETSSELVRKSKIIARREELQVATATEGVLTVTQRKERLSELAKEDNTGQFGLNRSPNISAIAELNKMEGSYAPEKHAILGDILIEVVYREDHGQERTSEDQETETA